MTISSEIKPSKEQQAILTVEKDTIVIANPGTGNTLTSLDKNIIQKLESDWDYIDINRHGQSHHVSLTTAGMAFIYEMSP